MFRSRALAAGACTALAAFAALPATTAVAAPPAPCNNAPQITDASGDGHHAPTDVLSAWWSEANGRLQAVIKVYAGTPAGRARRGRDPGGRVRVRLQRRSADALRPRDRCRIGGATDVTTTAPTRRVGGFTSAGSTTGVVESGPRTGGTVTIDVPAVAAGTRCSRVRSSSPTTASTAAGHWVDHAPGGALPTDPARGADYVVGSCGAAPGTPTPGGGGGRTHRTVRARPSSSPRPSASRAARP